MAVEQFETGQAVRRAARSGRLTGQTSGLAPGHVQLNLVMLPAAEAGDFLRFCVLNPKPCPLLGVSEAGDRRMPGLGADLDLATDATAYHVWQDGKVVAEVADVTSWWRDDLVSFALGCSFSFEEALLAEGLGIRHIEAGCNVPMYRTSLACAPAGRLAGPLVVTMRPFRAAQAIRAIQITSRYPGVHGAPVHLGRPDLIGIGDLARPDYGDAVAIADDEIPVFWACGVTPQAAIAAARLPFAITHAPGCMLVSDLLNTRLATS